MIRVASLIFLSAWLLAPSPSYAQAPRDVAIAGVKVGFDGKYKAGLWTPVDVTLRGGSAARSGQLAVIVPDGDGVLSRVATPPDEPVALAAGETKVTRLYVRFGRLASEMTVEFVPDGGPAVHRVFRAATAGGDYPAALASRRRLVVAVGKAADAVQDALGFAREVADERTVVAAVADPAELPERWVGYEAVSTVVISISESDPFARLDPDAPAIAALRQWIEMGGRLVLAVGGQAADAVKPGSAWSQLLPGPVEESIPLPGTAALEIFSGSTTPIPPGDSRMSISLLADPAGQVEAREGNIPLVVRRAVGFGQVVFLAVDVGEPSLAAWGDRGLLVARLVDLETSLGEEPEEHRAAIHFGFTDMSGQLRSALDRFQHVWAVPFWTVGLCIALYAAALGADYFLVNRLLRRPILTWVTFPLLVVAVSAGAWAFAHRVKGGEVRVNQVDLVDFDIASGSVRGTAWANVFSPASRRYDLSFAPWLTGTTTPADLNVVTAWLGLPGEALGGMEPRTAEADIGGAQYRIAHNLEALSAVPIPIWSSKSFTARWTARTEALPKADLTHVDDLPEGTITNTFDFPLIDCLLAYGPWAYQLETIRPGQTVEVGAKLERRRVKTFLTGRKIVFGEDEKFEDRATPYDQASVDVNYILRAMSFFDEAGGRRYTGLSNSYQGFVDMSDLLKTDRAILLARVTDAAAPGGSPLVLDGRQAVAEQHAGLYRFVIPVKRK